MTERNEVKSLPLWRSLVYAVAAMVVAAAVALALIPQLSLRATVRGGSIAIAAMVVSRIVQALVIRSRRRRAGD